LKAPSEHVAPGAAILARVMKRARAGRIPVAGTFELTARCNLQCIHCYQGPQACRPAEGAELPTAAFRRIIDDAVEAGCLQVLLTGGEPLLRRDFPEIYRHARGSGTLVTVFTNATLVTEEHVALFRDLPPAKVDVSIYGATPGTYEAVTGVKGSYARCLAGVERLVSAGIPTALKTVLLRTNQAEVGEMELLARSLGLKFRMDPVICPTLDGDLAPLGERVAPEIAAHLQFDDEARRARARAMLDVKPVAGRRRVYSCDAGTTAFYVTSRGMLRPCLMTTDMEFCVPSMGFEAAWRAATFAAGEPEWEPGDRCEGCPDLPICGFCPAILRFESGRASRPGNYLCELGRARRAVIEAGPGARQTRKKESHAN
jgi:radical SAM protein with 4Fe4S-binding SPASM domain